jgi:uncharacterized membrane protein
MTINPNVAYAIAVAGFLGLFALRMLWPTVLEINPRFPVAIMLLITVAPLLIPMRGFLRGLPKSSAWLAYVSLLYFMHGLVEAYPDTAARYFAGLEIVLSLMIFGGITVYLRALKARR